MHIKGLLTIRTLVTKLSGITFSIAAGLIAGVAACTPAQSWEAVARPLAAYKQQGLVVADWSGQLRRAAVLTYSTVLADRHMCL